LIHQWSTKLMKSYTQYPKDCNAHKLWKEYAITTLATNLLTCGKNCKCQLAQMSALNANFGCQACAEANDCKCL